MPAKTNSDVSIVEPLTSGLNYRRWSTKIIMFLEDKDVDYVIHTDHSSFSPATHSTSTKTHKQTEKDDSQDTAVYATPDPKAPAPTPPATLSQVSVRFEKDNKTTRAIILQRMANSLFDMFSGYKSAKVIWDLLRQKYGTDDAGRRKYAVGHWMNFRMNDSKSIVEQVHEFENLVADMTAERAKVNDVFLSGALIEELPDSWLDFKKKMKHERGDYTLQQLINSLNIEEENRLVLRSATLSNNVKANIVESSVGFDRPGPNDHTKNHKRCFKQNNNNQVKNGKIQKKGIGPGCFVFGKQGHRATQCYFCKGVNQNTKKSDNGGTKNQAHLIEDTDNTEVVAVVITEANIVGDLEEYVVDTRASRHFCNNKDMFKEFEPITEGEQVFMGNSNVSQVSGRGTVELMLYSEKQLMLKNVLYVPSLRRNLIFGALLNRVRIKMVFESDRLVMTCYGKFLGKGHLRGGLFVLDVSVIRPNMFEGRDATSIYDFLPNWPIIGNNNNGSPSAYITIPVNIWHDRLGHVGTKC
ncbi:uncharacterized protein LOC115999491 [Ipomoea triloba]|uniref:uncharacterized protein LOC115999491 n=1 Tax=Ipomoea triloba TaxID=35885 RepID=UPI00125CEC2F|nr:uncharacterized protein LOC115999491 [Ipomoea triloba]